MRGRPGIAKVEGGRNKKRKNGKSREGMVIRRKRDHQIQGPKEKCKKGKHLHRNDKEEGVRKIQNDKERGEKRKMKRW